MAQAQFGTVLRHLRRLTGPDHVQALTDAELVQRFAARREEAAFAALLQRYGRLVWSVCRRILRHEQDAEDAFQATFLVLARHAAGIRAGQAVSSWLRHVAYRIALKAGADRARRRGHEWEAEPMTHAEPGSELAWRELQAVLDEELRRLPGKYRAPFVLCCLEGKTKPEAARLLGWKEGTVSGRLAEARKQLRRRLARRGVALSALLCATALSTRATAAPLALAYAALRAALFGAEADDIPSAVIALARGVIPSMIVTRTRLVPILLLAAALFVAATGWLLAARPADQPPPRAVATGDGTKTPADADDELIAQGRVLDPVGKPFAGAKFLLGTKLLGESGADGSFRFVLSKAQITGGSPDKDLWTWANLVAKADGFGLAWTPLGRHNKEGRLSLRLVKDDVPLAGRVVDLEGRPVVGASVKVLILNATEEEDLSPFLQLFGSDPELAMNGGNALTIIDGKPEERSGPQWKRLWWPSETGLVPATKTDKEGKFRLTGIGRERFVELLVQGSTIEQLEVRILTRPGLDLKALAKPDPGYKKLFGGPSTPPPSLYGPSFDLIVRPTKPVTGIVRDQATGKPVVGVRIVGGPSAYARWSNVETVTDNTGSFRLVGLSKASRYDLRAEPDEKGNLLPQERELKDTEGLKPVVADFVLMKGVVVEGSLLDEATGKPLAGRVKYAPLPDNKSFSGDPRGSLNQAVMNWHSVAPDGRFRLVVYPGSGVVFALGDGAGYLRARIDPADEKRGLVMDKALVVAGRPLRVEGHAYRVIEPAEGAAPLHVDLACVSAAVRTGTVVGPDGKALEGADGIVLDERQAGPEFASPQIEMHAKGAGFTATGLEPHQSYLLAFWHTERKSAGWAEVAADGKGPVKVRLQAWGKLTGRLLDAGGKPLAGVEMRPYCRDKNGHELLAAWIEPLAKTVLTDAQGRFEMEGFVPGMSFELVGLVPKEKGEPATQVVCSVDKLIWKEGEAKDLGDLKVQR